MYPLECVVNTDLIFEKNGHLTFIEEQEEFLEEIIEFINK